MNSIEDNLAEGRGTLARARSGAGPSFIVNRTYRFMGHSRGDPNHGVYRSKEEWESWKKRDPINALRDGLVSMGWIKEEEFDQMDETVQAKIAAAVKFAETSPIKKRAVNRLKWRRLTG